MAVFAVKAVHYREGNTSILASILVSLTPYLQTYSLSCKKRFIHVVHTGLIKQTFQSKFINIVLPIYFSICFGGLKNPSY